MDPTTVQAIHDAIQNNVDVSIALKSGLVKSGRPLHFIHDKFLIIQTQKGNSKHDLIMIEDILAITLK